ncbi:hypothetical protein HPB50_022191 [Hyalomma asiaticum]|uniref:Uncharacterized protein n=1 Tax=Hyalomma asiaticum TaxID=266040 RepID=A0ACB7RSB0_HYAAI|nr:hypothetical protein HPB50_022191 [Hyalomma asiaticum]
MSAEDVDNLCCIFYNRVFEELHALDNQRLPWLLRISGLNLSSAVERIRACLKAIDAEQDRLNCTATLYAWLVPRGAYTPWLLYRLAAFAAGQREGTVEGMLVQLMQSASCYAGCGCLDVGTARCLTVLMRDSASSPPHYWPVCFCLWRGLPFMALYAPSMTLERATYFPGLAAIIGDLERCLHGIYDDLDSAHRAAKRSMGNLSALFRRSAHLPQASNL